MSIDEQERRQFGRRLERVMIAKGYKVTSLSVASQISGFMLQRWIAGEGMPTNTSIRRLARVLRVKTDHLTGPK